MKDLILKIIISKNNFYMISKLTIENFILIDKAEIDFSDGLNIISGETGSGKSILILALKMLFGERISTDQIRNKDLKTVLEGNFNFRNPEINSILIENDIDVFENHLIIRKELTLKGINRVFINDTPSNNHILKLLGEHLIDFHGQHDNQLILKSDNQLQLVDNYLNLVDLLKQFKVLYFLYQKTLSDYQLFTERKNKYTSDFEIETKELEELRQLNIKQNEIEAINTELELLESSEILNYEVNTINSLLFNNDNSAYNNISQALKHFGTIIKFDSKIKGFIDEIESAKIALKETFKHLSDLKENFEYNETKIEELKLRLRTLKTFEKRYGSQELIIERIKSLVSSQFEADNFEITENKFKTELAYMSLQLVDKANFLHQSRTNALNLIENEISSRLINLGIKNPIIKINIEPIKKTANSLDISLDNKNYILNSSGMDNIDFLISTNKGIAPASLKEIASGGEVSRVMLALKSIFASKDSIETYIFDEIDTGISGEIAKKVGIEMKNLSKIRQLIVITHLPQIAANSKNHINVSKQENEKHTVSSIRILNENEKLQSIAAMISGNQISDSALKLAKELTHQ